MLKLYPVADDFLVCGFGDTYDEALMNHDVNLQGFLNRARERDLKLNPDKVKLRCSSVTFIGHVLTDKGLCLILKRQKPLSICRPLK